MYLLQSTIHLNFICVFTPLHQSCILVCLRQDFLCSDRWGSNLHIRFTLGFGCSVKLASQNDLFKDEYTIPLEWFLFYIDDILKLLTSGLQYAPNIFYRTCVDKAKYGGPHTNLHIMHTSALLCYGVEVLAQTGRTYYGCIRRTLLLRPLMVKSTPALQ